MTDREWINGDIHPVNIGRYEVRFANPLKVTVASWDGRVWRHLVLPPFRERGEFFWRHIEGPFT